MNYIQENDLLTQLSGYASDRALLIASVVFVIVAMSLLASLMYLESRCVISLEGCVVIYSIAMIVLFYTGIGVARNVDTNLVKANLVIETQDVKVTLDEEILYEDIKEATTVIKIMEKGAAYYVNVDDSTLYSNNSNKEATLKIYKVKDFKGPLKWLLPEEKKKLALTAELTPTVREISYSK